jgi:hypothetical protein
MSLVMCGTCRRFAASADALDGHDCQPPAPPFPVITEAVKLTLKPGDVLALTMDRPLQPEQRRCVKDWLTEQFPPGIHTLVLDPGLSLQVVVQAPEGDAT